MNKLICTTGVIVFCFLACSLPTAFAADESISITTYYPSPKGSYKELTSYKMKIGTNYSGAGTSVADNDLLVEGNLGVGTATPAYQLQLSTDSAAKPSTNTWTIASDKRIKKDVRPYTNGLAVVKKINPVWFKYNGKAGFSEDNKDYIGVIAQEIAEVAPYTINTFKARLEPNDKTETELLNFNSHALTFDLINAVKELDAETVRLNQENQELKKANGDLAQEIEKIKARLALVEGAAGKQTSPGGEPAK